MSENENSINPTNLPYSDEIYKKRFQNVKNAMERRGVDIEILKDEERDRAYYDPYDKKIAIAENDFIPMSEESFHRLQHEEVEKYGFNFNELKEASDRISMDWRERPILDTEAQKAMDLKFTIFTALKYAFEVGYVPRSIRYLNREIDKIKMQEGSEQKLKDLNYLLDLKKDVEPSNKLGLFVALYDLKQLGQEELIEKFRTLFKSKLFTDGEEVLNWIDQNLTSEEVQSILGLNAHS